MGQQPRRKRWGLRTLGFLMIALASVLTSNMRTSGGQDQLPITVVGVVVGFAGAAYCTYRGLREFNWLER